jgi:hypothetical protein
MNENGSADNTFPSANHALLSEKARRIAKTITPMFKIPSATHAIQSCPQLTQALAE